MKKTLFLVIALLSWQFVPAEVVTEKQARQRAADFFSKAEVQTKTTPVRPDDFKLVGTFPDVATKSSSSAPAMFIFDRSSGGYAIVSGDDVARPVLGYSLGGHFPIEDMPDNLRAMLQWYADVIDFARQQHWASAAETETDTGLDPANTVLLQTAQWNQWSPFNDLVPEINGQKPPIGCVATAIAIVMKYYKWPLNGSGTIPSYDYSINGQRIHVSSIVLGHKYDWSIMPDEYRTYSAEEAAQIARLLYDVAVMCRIAFNPNGSGTSLFESSTMLLPLYFGYDKQIHFFIRSDGYFDCQWEQYVIDEINACRPVLYAAAGHAFVIDGYNGRYFSINYGWGGDSVWRDGHDRTSVFKDFYTLTPIENHEEDLIIFNNLPSMVCGVMPDSGNVAKPNLVAQSQIELPADFCLGKEFILDQVISNHAYGTSSANLSFCLYDRHGIIKEQISPAIFIEELSGELLSRHICRVSRELEGGDMILLAVLDSHSGNWVPIPHKRAGKIVFTNSNLAELIEIGYSEDAERSDDKRKCDLFFTVYKDICWRLEIANSDSWQPLFDNRSGIGNYVRDGCVSFGYMLSIDPQCETMRYEIWLPSGYYVLRVHNPANGEEMEINLEV